jgi:uncharacterized repeat protein (TIGR03803 family)
MTSMRFFESLTVVRLARMLLPAWLLAASAASFAQSTPPAVSTIVAFSASIPNGGIIQGRDGALYGTSSSTSAVTGGLVFRAAADGSSVKTLHQLSNTEAYAPKAGLLLASDGLLYGTTVLGAITVEANTSGTVFRIKADGTGFEIVHRFAQSSGTNQDSNAINTDGASPESPVVEGSDGYLYGMTKAGGPNGTGAIFRMSRDGTAFTVLHTFGPVTSAANSGLTSNVDGAGPVGLLLQWSDGYLYGTTSAGGVNGRGTIFRIRMDGTDFQTLHEFSALSTTGNPPTNSDGAVPIAGLTDGRDGRLYGVASQGGANGVGTLFAFDPGSRLLTVLHNFADATGNGPAGELLLGRDTKLYGTTSNGGTTSGGSSSNFGTLFSIARDGTGFSSLHSFESSEGARPVGKLLQLNDTTFVGVTSSSGKCGQGTLFQYSTTGAKVAGNTTCGQKKNYSNGGGSTAPAMLLLISVLGFARWRRSW